MRILKLIGLIVAVIVAGLLVGNFAGRLKPKTENNTPDAVLKEDTKNEEAPPVLYNCPRHPQEVSTEPGKCSICGARLEVMV